MDQNQMNMTTKILNTKGLAAPAWRSLNRVIAGLELDVPDDPVLDFIEMLAREVHVEELRFVHVLPPVKMFYNTLDQKTLSDWSRVAEEVTSEVRSRLEGRFDNGRVNVRVEVRNGEPQEELLKDAEFFQPDLLVIGQRSARFGHEILARRLARQAECNVLVVPEGSSPSMQSVLVPVDFSELSAKALRAAVELKMQFQPDMEITCLHVWDLPAFDWHRIQRSEKEMADMLETDRRSALEQFARDHAGEYADTLHLLMRRIDNGQIGKAITDYAEENKMDMIAMGAIGHSMVAALLLGSVAERVLSTSDGVPVLIIR